MKSALTTALTGLELENGWVIEGPRAKCAGTTGACYAVGFTARHSDGRRAFFKVMDSTPDPTLEGSAQLGHLGRWPRASAESD